LTNKQEAFVQELMKGKSQREAYKKAYNTSRMTDKTIDEASSRLLKKSKVNARYNELRDKLIKEAEKESLIEAKDIIKELTQIALSDIGDILTFKTVKVVAARDEDGEPVFEYRPVIEFKDSSEVNTSLISEISLSSKGLLKIKMHDKMAALGKLSEILGLNVINREKLNISWERLEEERKKNMKNVW